MKPKNTICLWFDKDAHEAARFYAAAYPNSEVTAVREAPGDYPGGKEGDVLMVEFPSSAFPVWVSTAARSSGTARRAFEAMMPMKKIDIATIEAARRGNAHRHSTLQPSFDSN